MLAFKSKAPFEKVSIMTQFPIKFQHENTRWKKEMANRKKVEGNQERVTCTRVSSVFTSFSNMKILRYLMTFSCLADCVIPRDLFQLKSTQIVVLNKIWKKV